MGAKNLLITRPGDFLSEGTYVRYLQILSRIFSIGNRSTKPIHIKRQTSGESISSSVAIWNIYSPDFNILTPSGFRASRFLKGFARAANRQWERYGIDDLLMGERPDVVFDVGANIGEFTLAGQQRGIKEIYSFEPDPTAFACLSYNIQVGLTKLFNFALGDVTGEGIFYSAPEGADSSLIKPDVASREIRLPIYRLEDFIESESVQGRILIKMDAEGAEPEVLRGFGKHADTVSWISIDVGPERQGQSTKVEVEELLQGYGFTTSFYSEWILHGRK